MPHSPFLCLLACAIPFTLGPERAFGFGAETSGGRGGKIIRVTNLNSDGEGSLRRALRTEGKRVVVFEVGGVIDLKGDVIKVNEPFVTIAGQTAPGPGITLIRGGIIVQTHDVIVQHLMVRPGENGRPKKSGWEADGISTNRAHNVLIDHCSCTWATDENLSVSGPRTEGDTPEEWRKNTSHHVTIQNCLIAEGLSNSTHAKGEHSKGTLIHDNASSILIWNNLYASNKDRNPYIKGGSDVVIVNNWISNPASKAISHGVRPTSSELLDAEPQPSRMVIVGNVVEHGPNSAGNTPLLRMYGGKLRAWMQDNIVKRLDGKPGPETGPEAVERLAEPPFWPGKLEAIPADALVETLAKEVGARPWDRDPIDERIVKLALTRKGKFIDSEDEWGGYPQRDTVRAEFVEQDWDLGTMTKRK